MFLQDSPTSKLLYNKEVQGYKVKVKQFYSDVKQMPRIPEDAMQYFLRQLSEVHACHYVWRVMAIYFQCESLFTLCD